MEVGATGRVPATQARGREIVTSLSTTCMGSDTWTESLDGAEDTSARMGAGPGNEGPKTGGDGVDQDCTTAEQPYWHDACDFAWEDLRDRVQNEVQAHLDSAPLGEIRPAGASMTAVRGDETDWKAGATNTQGQIDGWERHFRKHLDAPVPFFKERRGLLQMFPVLKTPGVHVLEVGCGNGSCVLPLLRGNPTATVHATDPSPTAVDDTVRRSAEQGLGARLTHEVQPTATVPCSPEHGPFDHVMILCTLSAIPGSDDGALLASAAAQLRPGGSVLIRDHARYDMRHLTDVRRGATLLDRERPAYLRPGGMHRRYYSREDVAALAAGAGLAVEENRYLCIRQRNARKQLEWDRVYLQSVLRRPADP